MQYDDLYDYIGHMGTFQWIIFIVMFILNSYTADFVNMIFVGGEMEHWCRIAELSHLPAERQKYIAIPLDDSKSQDRDVATYSSCEMFDVNWTTFSRENLINWNRSEWLGSTDNSTIAVRQCSSWNFNRSIFTSTIVSRFDLVCDDAYLVDLVLSLILAASLVGTLSTGAVSDRFGRRTALKVSLAVKMIGTVIALLANDYVTFVIGRVITAVGSCGNVLIAYVFVMEFTGPKYRTIIAVVFQVAYSVGYMMIPVFAYFVRDDNYLQMATMVPPVLLLPYVFFMPESPRWLIVRSRYDEALSVLQQMCKTNNTKLPDGLQLANLEEETAKVQDRSCSAFLQSRGMLCRTVIVNFSWFTTALVYFALSMFPAYEKLSTNLFLTTFISGAVEIPANIGAIFLIETKFLGRRKTAGFSLIGAGVASFMCAIMINYDVSVAPMLLSILGKVIISLAYAAVYLHASEIFPTEIRSVGLGTAATIESVGATLAPTVGGLLKRFWLPLPSVVYALLATISGVTYFYLPETRGQPLPDTIEQADNMAAEQRRRRLRLHQAEDAAVPFEKPDVAVAATPNGVTYVRRSMKPTNV